MQNVKLPHWAQILIGFIVMSITWIMNEQSQGQLVLPATVINVLSVALVLLGLFSSSVSPSVNAKAAAVKLTSGALLMGALGLLVFSPTNLTVPATQTAGCAWWKANSQSVVIDVGQIASCIIAQLFQGADTNAIVSAGSGATITDIEAIVASLIDYYDSPTPAGALTHSKLASATLAKAKLPETLTIAQVAQLHAMHAQIVVAKAHP